MNNYYRPYWVKDNELEHYGVKGMKWGKKRTPQELKGTKFSDAKVSETINYLKANPIQIPNIQEIKTTEVAKTKRKIHATKMGIKNNTKVKVKNIDKSIINTGKKIINKILGVFKKK